MFMKLWKYILNMIKLFKKVIVNFADFEQKDL